MVETSESYQSAAQPLETGRRATNRDGRCRVVFPRVLPKVFGLQASKPGYVPRFYSPNDLTRGAGRAGSSPPPTR